MPTPGATSGSVNDMIANSFVDNGDGTYSQRAATPAQSNANQWATIAQAGVTAAAPAANATICSATVPAGQGGYYDIVAQAGYGATAEATTYNNVVVAVGGSSISHLPLPVGAANTLQAPQSFRKQLSAGQTVNLNIDGTAGSAGSIYMGFISITRTA